jgi:hypothetical protein
LNRFGLAAIALVVIVLAGTAALVSLAPGSVVAYGTGDGRSDTHTLIGTPVPFSLNSTTKLLGDYVAAGVGMRGTGGPTTGGTITLPGVPVGSTIAKAFLYWAEINSTSMALLGQGSINGHAITGTNYGTTASPCWDTPSAKQIYAYVADVTAFANFGANTLSGFQSGGPPPTGTNEPLLDGASLVLVYQNNSSSGHQVDVYQGTRSFAGTPTETLNMSGYTAVAGTSHTSWVVADAQGFDSFDQNETSVNGVMGPLGNINGADGNYWDTHIQDVSTQIPSGNTSIQVGLQSDTQIVSGHNVSDCITWVAQVLSTPITGTTFTVNKAYSPSGSLASVPVSVTCTSGIIAPSTSGTSAPGTPFVVSVVNFTPGATCSASETTVPQGYIMTSTCNPSGGIPITTGVPASCTITNTETSTTFTVNKVYSPANPHPPVPVTVTCTSGIVTTPSGTAAPGSPFTTVVHKFNVTGTTCSATETVPAGYSESDNCSNVPISNGAPASCTFTNSLLVIACLPMPNIPCPVGGFVDVVTGGSSGSGSSMSWLAVLVLAVVAMGTLAGGTFAVVRKRS